jgi:hypothetical protein
MQNDINEQNRITLAITFIATYLTIIIGFSNAIKAPSSELSLINDILWGIFIFFGIAICVIFFLYLTFTALYLDFHKEKQVIFDQKVSKEKIEKARRFLFTLGVDTIFGSFTYPIYYLLPFLQTKFNIILATILWGLCLALSYIMLYILFRDKK